MRIAHALLWVALLLGRAAAAEPTAAPAAEPPLPLESTTAPVVPVVRLSGDTKGSSKIEVGLDLVRPIAALWDLFLEGGLQLQTSQGIGTLFDLSGGSIGAGSTGSLRLTAFAANAPIRLGEPPEPKLWVKREALRRCIAVEAGSDKKAEWQRHLDSLQGGEFNPQKLCDEGLRIYNARTAIHNQHFASRYLLALGVDAGLTVNRFLPTAMDTQERSQQDLSYSLAASFTWVSPRGATIELPLTFDSRAVASSARARLCAAGASGSDCADHIVGAPSRALRLMTQAQLGYTDARTGTWRLSAGPTLSYQSSASGDVLKLGLQAPVYLNATALLPQNVTRYRGLVRVVPTFTASHSAAGWETQFTVQVALLGQRLLFNKALEWLD